MGDHLVHSSEMTSPRLDVRRGITEGAAIPKREAGPNSKKPPGYAIVVPSQSGKYFHTAMGAASFERMNIRIVTSTSLIMIVLI